MDAQTSLKVDLPHQGKAISYLEENQKTDCYYTV